MLAGTKWLHFMQIAITVLPFFCLDHNARTADIKILATCCLHNDDVHKTFLWALWFFVSFSDDLAIAILGKKDRSCIYRLLYSALDCNGNTLTGGYKAWICGEWVARLTQCIVMRNNSRYHKTS